MSQASANTGDQHGKRDAGRPDLTRLERLLRELEEGNARAKRLGEEADYWDRIARRRGE